MREWATLPAGLRFPSGISTAHGSLLGHGNTKLGLRCLSHQNAVSSSTSRSLYCPRMHRNRCYRVHRPQITRWEPRRAFSGSLRAQILIIDDEEEPETPSPPQTGHRPLNGPGITHRNLDDLIRTRERREKERAEERATKPLDRKKLKEIENKARVLDEAYKLGDEFLQLKYAPVEYSLSHSAEAIREVGIQYDNLISSYVSYLENCFGQTHQTCQYLEHAYCVIAFRPIGSLKKKLLLLDKRTLDLQIAVFTQSVHISRQFAEDLRVHLDKEYLQARNSARSRIDQLLKHAVIAADQYNELQAKAVTVSNGLSAIMVLLRSLDDVDVRKESPYETFLDTTASISSEFSSYSHEHRWRWRMSSRYRNPLGDAFSHEFSGLLESIPSSTSRILTSKIIATIMFDDKKHRKIKAILAKRLLREADCLRRPYLQKWRGPQRSWSPEMNKYWRQLDVLAPFDLQRVYATQLLKEILYLVPTIQGGFGPMWEGLEDHDRKVHQTRLSDWYMKYRKQQKDFLAELSMYRYINWYRLGLEEKLAKLGVPNLIQAQGLFVPNEPLSQDLERFKLWVHKIIDIRHQGWISEMTFRMLKEPDVLETWLEMTKKFHERAAERKSRILDLGTVRVRRRGVSQKKAKHTRFAKSKKKVRRKPAGSVRSQPTSKSSASHSTKTTTTPHEKTKDGHPSKSSGAPKEKKAEKSPSGSTSTPQKSSASSKRKATRSKLNPTVVWNLLGQAKKEQPPRPATADAKIRFRQAMSMNDEPVCRPPDTSKTTKSTAVPQFTAKPRWTKDENMTKGQPGGSENPKHDQASKGRPSTVGNPLKSNKRNFWDPNPVASSDGLFRKSSKRSYSTSSDVSNDRTLDCNHTVLPGSAPRFPVKPTVENHGELPISAEDACHLEIESTSTEEAPLFWSHSDQRAPSGQRPIVHYCKSLESTESVARHFLNSKVVGFDMEWKAQASATDSIQNNLSLIQLANEERIALFQIALFKPARSLKDFVAPSLKRVIESSDITKVGVSIKADSTRLRKFLGIEARSIFELSHLYKLVKYGQRQPKLVNKRTVNLSEQVDEHLGLPLEKSEDVRCGDWARSLNYRQVQYAATDPYACICLFNTMEQKRQAMDPVPPRPAHAELNLPIICPAGEVVNVEDKEVVPGIVDGDVIHRS